MFKTTTGTAPGIPDHRQVPLEPPRAEIGVHRGDQEDRLDIGGQDLFVDRRARRRARQRALPIEARVNDGAIAGAAACDPIAHGRKVGRAARLVTKPAAHLRCAVEFAGDSIQPALLFDHARHARIRPIECRSLLFEKRTPAQTFQ